ncbi:hypothetical protein E4T47_08300 [Aureobasidium subglaciale]|nr:hypothetical protein E4T47_08300 [Aureobasidium subglaciale]
MDMLSKATKPAQQTLTIRPKRLVKIGSNFGEAATQPKMVAKHEPLANPTWLPPPDNIKIKCNVCCTLAFNDDAGANSGRALYTKSHLASLTGVRDDKGDLTFAIDMEPFIVDGNQLLTTQLTNHDANGGRRWKKERLKDASLGIGITCFNSEDAFELLSVVDTDILSGQAVFPEQAELRAAWKKLPACPESPLPLRRYYHESEARPKLGASKRLEYLFDVDISWSAKAKLSGTPLAMCNNITQTIKSKNLPQLRSTAQKPTICHITYVFDGGVMGTRSIARTRLSCVFCPDRLPHATFDRLHFHYLSHHDHFTFQVHTPPATNSSWIIRTVRVELSLPKYERASDNVSDQREITWIKPDVPFDLQQYLSEGGFNTWASGKPSAPKIFAKTIKPSLIRKGIARAKGSPANGQPPTSRPLKPPEEVKDIPPRRRLMYTVPDLEEVTLFRAESKRIIEPGEVLSESDAEPDDSWLWIRHRKEEFPQLTGAARDFVTLFDDHLVEEPTINGGVQLCESIVRFVRKHALLLGQPRMLQEFETKLNQLKRRKLIRQNYIDYCFALIANKGQPLPKQAEKAKADSASVIGEGSKPAASHVLSPDPQRGHNRLDVIMINDSDEETGAEVSPAICTSSHREQVPDHPATNGVASKTGKADDAGDAGEDVHMEDAVHHAPNTCICGKIPMGVRNVITCQNLRCPHSEFHIACVGLKKRVRGWRCEDCRPLPIS